eukprot:TRINITY_DN1213_c0_g1_i1.p1 TRINITY_DN1213_c0_g1~~TRINITY_DN1213_c0_g1_i1.p1  ORF type:complete len:243 (+),score=22.58 TRINITY_DN1213_c0_g1_i1:111-839(+)
MEPPFHHRRPEEEEEERRHHHHHHHPHQYPQNPAPPPMERQYPEQPAMYPGPGVPGPAEPAAPFGYPQHYSSGPGIGAPGASIPRRVLPEGQACRVFCKANPHFSLCIRDDKVVLAHSKDNDETQHWIKDETTATRVKDERGFPSFALVNKATGQTLKHGLGESQPVELAEYQQNVRDESILWSMSEDMGEGYRTLRQVNDIRLNMDAYHGDKKSGGVKEGTAIVLWKWNKGENQLWKIVPY